MSLSKSCETQLFCIIYEAEVTSLILNVVAILIASLKTMYFFSQQL